MIQLNPTIRMSCPKGVGYANFMIDYGCEGDVYWIIFLDNGEVWSFPNKQVRVGNNITMGRVATSSQPEWQSI